MPNPVVGNAAIGFELQSTQKISLEIIDVLGRSALVLKDVQMEAGSHSIDVSNQISSSTAGVYFIRLKTEMELIHFKWIKQ